MKTARAYTSLVVLVYCLMNTKYQIFLRPPLTQNVSSSPSYESRRVFARFHFPLLASESCEGGKATRNISLTSSVPALGPANLNSIEISMNWKRFIILKILSQYGSQKNTILFCMNKGLILATRRRAVIAWHKT